MINKIIIFLLAFSLSGCINNIESKHGYNFEYINKEDLKIRLTNKEQVLSSLGAPSTKSSFGPEIWYYISFKNKQYAFLDPKQDNNTIITISFNDDDTVQNISFSENKSFAKNSYDHEITPIYGTKQNFLQKSLNNIGFGPSLQGK